MHTKNHLAKAYVIIPECKNLRVPHITIVPCEPLPHVPVTNTIESRQRVYDTFYFDQVILSLSLRFFRPPNSHEYLYLLI